MLGCQPVLGSHVEDESLDGVDELGVVGKVVFGDDFVPEIISFNYEKNSLKKIIPVIIVVPPDIFIQLGAGDFIAVIAVGAF